MYIGTEWDVGDAKISIVKENKIILPSIPPHSLRLYRVETPANDTTTLQIYIPSDDLSENNLLRSLRQLWGQIFLHVYLRVIERWY